MTAQEKIDKVRSKANGGDSPAQLYELLQQQRSAIAAAAPKHLDPDRAIRIAWNAIRTGSGLLKCSPMSVLTSVMEATQLGLELDGVLGQAYLIPRRNKHTKRTEAQMQIGYRGLIAIAMRDPHMIAVNSGCVREGDEFDYREGTDGYVHHKRALRGRGEIYGSWCVGSMDRGGHVIYIAGEDDIRRAKAASHNPDQPGKPWHDHPDAMWAKTAIRRCLMNAPLSADILTPIVRDDYRDHGVASAAPVVGAGEDLIDIEPEQAEAS